MAQMILPARLAGGRFPRPGGRNTNRPVALNLTPPAPPDRRWTPPKYLFVGNNWERKNGEGVVRAFGSLRTFVPDAELHLVGDHPDVRAPGVTAHGRLSFSIPDQRAELESLFCASTCFVMPSWLEAFGIVYVEAAAAGLPSIGTTVGGTETSIGDGGILVDPADDRGLLEAMRQLAEPQFAHKLGTRARQRADAFTWRACAERVVRAFAPDLADDLGMADFLSVQHR